MMEFGIINNSRGLKGELKVTHLCDYKELYEEVGEIIIDDKPRQIEYIKYHKDNVILKLKGVDTIEEAEKYKSKIIYIEREKLPELEKGRYYIVDLMGLKGQFENGEAVGVLKDVLQTGAADIFTFEDENKKSVLIPKVDEFITEIDIEKGIIYLTEKARELVF